MSTNETIPAPRRLPWIAVALVLAIIAVALAGVWAWRARSGPPGGQSKLVGDQRSGLSEDVALLTVEDLLTTPVPVDDSLRAEQEDILQHDRRAGIIATIPDLSGAFDPASAVPPDDSGLFRTGI